MYADHSPFPNFPRGVDKVLVLEPGDELKFGAKKIIEEARTVGAISDVGGQETFWIIYAAEPKRVWDFTEESLLMSIWDAISDPVYPNS